MQGSATSLIRRTDLCGRHDACCKGISGRQNGCGHWSLAVRRGHVAVVGEGGGPYDDASPAPSTNALLSRYFRTSDGFSVLPRIQRMMADDVRPGPLYTYIRNGRGGS